MEDDFLVTITDLRRFHCAAGIARWFKDHDLDLRDFLTNGIMASDLVASGDELAERAVRMLQETRNG